MAYPSVNFQPAGQVIGSQPINSSSATQNHQPGAILAGVDLTYGTAEFIYLKGVASTVPGEVVCYSSQTGATVRAVHAGATSIGPLAVAMSANVAGQYGWYAISGSVPVKSGTVGANAAAYLTSTAGQVDDAVVSGDEIAGLVIQAADSGGYATCQLARPNVSGIGGSATGSVTFSGAVIRGAFATPQTIDLGYADNGVKIATGSNSGGDVFITDLGGTAFAHFDVHGADSTGNFESTTVGKGFILKSPDGTRYLLKVANDGTVSASAAP